MSAADVESGASRARLGERVCLVVLLVAAFALRATRIELFFAGPDEGNYLHSALVHELEPGGFHPIRWIGEDVRWVGHLRAHYAEESVTYQHSYLHQLLARWLFRFGCGAMQSLRMSSAITGTLTVFFAWWVFARLWPARRRLGLLAAAIVAFAPFHVFYSRTGWGQIGFACFYLAYTVVLYRVLFVIDAEDKRAMRRAGWSLLALSLLSFGWHEGVAPFIVGCGVVVALAPWIQRRPEDERGWKESVLRSNRTWTWFWSAIPVGAATVALMFFSDFAQKKWFNADGLPRLPWWELKQRSVQDLFVSQRADLQVGWTLLALALIGVVAWHREQRGMARFFVTSTGAGAIVLFLRFGDGYLFRIYMPLFLVICLCATVGVAACARWLGARAGHLIAALFVFAVLASLAFTSWTTEFGRVESPFFVQHFYARTDSPPNDWREVDTPIRERLRTEMRAGDEVRAWIDKTVIFRLQDVGIRAREDYTWGDPSTWPRWIVGTRRASDGSGFEQDPHFAANGGEYEFVLAETIGRWGLYRRVR